MRIVIYNLAGQVVDVLENSVIGGGYHTVNWTVGNDGRASSGVYFCRMYATSVESGETYSSTGKLIMVH